MSSIRHFMLIWINSPNYWIKKKCDLTRNDGLPFGWEISGGIIRGRNSKTNGEQERMPSQAQVQPQKQTFIQKGVEGGKASSETASQFSLRAEYLSLNIKMLFLWCLREICLAWGCLWFQLIEYVCYNYFKMPSVLTSLPVQVQSYVRGEGKEKRRSVLFRT